MHTKLHTHKSLAFFVRQVTLSYILLHVLCTHKTTLLRYQRVKHNLYIRINLYNLTYMHLHLHNHSPQSTMFKKFSADEINSFTQLKSSIQRNIKKKIIDTYPTLNTPNNILDDTTVDTNNELSTITEIDILLPKKCKTYLIKAANYVQAIAVNNEILFFSIHDGPWIPTLHTLHKYPFLLPKWTCDTGAIKFVLSGANVMCPGLTHKDASMEPLESGKIVAIYAAGKPNAMGIGITTMSDADVRSVNKGVCVEMYHHMLDGLWMNPNVDTK